MEAEELILAIEVCPEFVRQSFFDRCNAIALKCEQETERRIQDIWEKNSSNDVSKCQDAIIEDNQKLVYDSIVAMEELADEYKSFIITNIKSSLKKTLSDKEKREKLEEVIEDDISSIDPDFCDSFDNLIIDGKISQHVSELVAKNGWATIVSYLKNPFTFVAMVLGFMLFFPIIRVPTMKVKDLAPEVLQHIPKAIPGYTSLMNFEVKIPGTDFLNDLFPSIGIILLVVGAVQTYFLVKDKARINFLTFRQKVFLDAFKSIEANNSYCRIYDSLLKFHDEIMEVIKKQNEDFKNNK